MGLEPRTAWAVRSLSERLNRIIEQKRAGTLAAIALIKELEELTAQVIEVVQEAQPLDAPSRPKRVRSSRSPAPAGTSRTPVWAPRA
jgi:type I restriction enzyme R subunit